MTSIDTTTTPGDDLLSRFLLPHAGVRGVHVRLGATWREILARDTYPAGVRALLGQATAASALFTGHAKVEGRLSVQLRGDGAISTLFAECTGAGTLRAIARFDAEADDPGTDPRALGDGAMLAITIENPLAGAREPARYQGIVDLSAPTLAAAFEDYFDRSEQLPTRLLLATGDDHACGLMLQKLPGDAGDDDGWRRARVLADTLGEDELLAQPFDVLLHRLFHEEAPETFAPKPLSFACSCSRERVAAMLQSLGEEEARASVVDGAVRIRCEFCGQSYVFLPADLDPLFTGSRAPMASPAGLQ